MRPLFSFPYSGKRLLNALALYLAQPVKRHSAATTSDPKDLAAVLLPGDVLLTDGNTRITPTSRRAISRPLPRSSR